MVFANLYRSGYSKKCCKRCKRIVISNRAYTSIVAEALSRDPLETGGILLGVYDDDIWYVVEATDPGIETIHSTIHNEMDEIYHNHIYPVLSRLYKHDLRLVGLWHRHPGSLNTFSQDDKRTNEAYAKAIGNGTLSFILNFTPDPKLTCYYLDQKGTGTYYFPRVDIGDAYFENTDHLKLADTRTLIERKAQMQAEIKGTGTEPEKKEAFKMIMSEDSETFDYDLVEGFFKAPVRKNYHLSINSEILSDIQYEGEIHGTACEETGKYYAFVKGEAGDPAYTSHGLIVNNERFQKFLDQKEPIEGYDYFGTYINDGWVFYKTDVERSHVTCTMFDLVTRLFSRNTGLLESGVMGQKTALIVGCGSVGSLIALELARAGVGHFILIDGDTLEIHNICRHQLGFKDLGRYKVDAVADGIRNINPNAQVVTFKGILQNVPMDMLNDFKDGIVIGTGDNRESGAAANELAKVLKVPFVATGCWQRSHAGECFYWCPDKNMPLYREAFAGLITEERPASHQHYFADDEDEKNLNFEPGVSTDIGFVTLVAVKIIYDLLNRDTDKYTTRVLGYLKNYTLICNTNEPAIGGKNAEMFPHPLFISNTISVGGYKKGEIQGGGISAI